MSRCAKCGERIAVAAESCAACGEPVVFDPEKTVTGPEDEGLAAAGSEEATRIVAGDDDATKIARPRGPAGRPIAAFVLSLLACVPLLPIVGGVLGLVSRRRMAPGAPRRGLATAAAVIGLGIYPVFLLVFAVFAAIGARSLLDFGVRSKQTEARIRLKSLSPRVAAFREEHGRAPVSFAELNYDGERPRRYAIFLGEDALQPVEGGPWALPELEGIGTASGPVAVAVADLDDDGRLDVWTLPETGEPVNVANDVTDDRRIKAVRFDPQAPKRSLLPAPPPPEPAVEATKIEWSAESPNGQARIFQVRRAPEGCFVECDLRSEAVWRSESCRSNRMVFVSDDCAHTIEIDLTPSSAGGWKGTPVVFLYSNERMTREVAAAELVKDGRKVVATAGLFSWVGQGDRPRYRADGRGVELKTIDGKRWSLGFDGSGFPGAKKVLKRVPSGKQKPVRVR